jgi:SAM-dependent methyltransferase
MQLTDPQSAFANVPREREVQMIVESARRSIQSGRESLGNLDHPRGVVGYQSKADEMARWLHPGMRLLDWGCNYGQMAWLMRMRGMEVAALDVAENRHPTPLLDSIGVQPLFVEDPIALPYDDKSFDAVLSCGVLEHVSDVEASLKEVRRILKPGGIFFIYNLPNALSWIEWCARRLGSGHERRWTLSAARRLVTHHGFDVTVARVEDVLPRNLGVLPLSVRQALFSLDPVMETADRVVVHTPLRWFGTNLTFITRAR